MEAQRAQKGQRQQGKHLAMRWGNWTLLNRQWQRLGRCHLPCCKAMQAE